MKWWHPFMAGLLSLLAFNGAVAFPGDFGDWRRGREAAAEVPEEPFAYPGSNRLSRPPEPLFALVSHVEHVSEGSESVSFATTEPADMVFGYYSEELERQGWGRPRVTESSSAPWSVKHEWRNRDIRLVLGQWAAWPEEAGPPPDGASVFRFEIQRGKSTSFPRVAFDAARVAIGGVGVVMVWRAMRRTLREREGARPGGAPLAR